MTVQAVATPGTRRTSALKPPAMVDKVAAPIGSAVSWTGVNYKSKLRCTTFRRMAPAQLTQRKLMIRLPNAREAENFYDSMVERFPLSFINIIKNFPIDVLCHDRR